MAQNMPLAPIFKSPHGSGQGQSQDNSGAAAIFAAARNQPDDDFGNTIAPTMALNQLSQLLKTTHDQVEAAKKLLDPANLSLSEQEIRKKTDEKLKAIADAEKVLKNAKAIVAKLGEHLQNPDKFGSKAREKLQQVLARLHPEIKLMLEEIIKNQSRLFVEKDAQIESLTNEIKELTAIVGRAHGAEDMKKQVQELMAKQPTHNSLDILNMAETRFNLSQKSAEPKEGLDSGEKKAWGIRFARRMARSRN
jgi:hypothetical protein